MFPVLTKISNKMSRNSKDECVNVLVFFSTSKLLNSLTNRDFASRYSKDGWKLFFLPRDTVQKVYCIFARNYDGDRNKFPSLASLHYKPQHNQTNFDNQGILTHYDFMLRRT